MYSSAKYFWSRTFLCTNDKPYQSHRFTLTDFHSGESDGSSYSYGLEEFLAISMSDKVK